MVPSKRVLGAGVGHGYYGAVATEIGQELEWLVGSDPRWAATP